jgi:AcrR family transcriptional regulator
MVSQRRPTPTAPHETPSSRDRVFRAAATEFAARGFDGAKVDRIAARARLNKAMLYYHFPSKAALYREVLVDMFASTAAATRAARDAGGAPETQLAGFIRAIAREGEARPHFPSMWLRELAEGGRHLDDSVIVHFRSVIGTLGEILDEGRRTGVFGPAHPFVTQLGIVGPLLLFLASAPIRGKFAPKVGLTMPPVDVETMIAHVERMTVGALTASRRPPRRMKKGSR